MRCDANDSTRDAADVDARARRHAARARSRGVRRSDKEASQAMVDESIVMARLEGLEGHARAAETRSTTAVPAYKKERREDQINA